MLTDFRFPIYSNAHGQLFTALHADVVGLRGRELFYEGSHLRAVQAINQHLDEKFMQPVSRFQRAYQVIRDQHGFDNHEASAMAIELITRQMSNKGKLRCSRALVTCGLVARPEAFPAAFRIHMDYVDCAKGELDENLLALNPDDLTEQQLEASRNTQLLMLSREDELLQRWRGPRIKHPKQASEWPRDLDDTLSVKARLRVMLGILNGYARGHGHRLG